MTIVTDFQTGVAQALDFGQQIRIKYYNIDYGAGSYYDDDIVLTQSGVDFWTSGVILPVYAKSRNAEQSSEAVLMAQGKLLMSDSKLYIDGSVPTSGTIKIGLGSPVISGGEYSLLSEGVMKWDVNATTILKKLYIRHLTNGSLIGE